MNINPVDNANIIVAITTLVVTIIIKKCALDNVYYGMLYTVVLQVLTKSSSIDYNLTLPFDIHYIKYILPIILSCIIIYYFKNKSTTYVKLSIVNQHDMNTFN